MASLKTSSLPMTSAPPPYTSPIPAVAASASASAIQPVVPAATNATTTGTTSTTTGTRGSGAAGGVEGETVTLAVSPQPEQEMAFTNYVYVSPEETTCFPRGESGLNYVTLNDIVFLVKSHEKMGKGNVGLNKVQRESCKFTTGQQTRAVAWSPPTDGSLSLLSVKFDLEVLGAAGRKFQLEEEKLIQFVKKQYPSHVLCVNQAIVAKFGGVVLTFTVVDLEVPLVHDEKDNKAEKLAAVGSISKLSKYGVLLSSTDVEFIAPNKKHIVLEKFKRKSRPFDPRRTFVDMGIGGLDEEFGVIFRRTFGSRFFPPEVIQQLGIKHVKGMLLYGPPGTGKTLIARQIGKLLDGREPKVVNGPEILNKFVGASEENIRNLFKDAEEDYKQNKENSDLHLIIFDEIDAICRARGTVGGGTGVHDTVVNQLLSKIDGVNALNNILVIGMTNRKDLIDPALLRPGRLEVHVEISLPDLKGREQIFMIHTKTMRASNRLGKDVDIPRLAELTKNYSGAEIEGLVKSACSFALYSAIDVQKDKAGAREEDFDNIVVNMEQFERALEETVPAFGVAENELKTMLRGELIDYGPEFQRLMSVGRLLAQQVRNSDQTPLMTILFEGESGAGMSSVAAKLALDANFPFMKVISPENFIGMNESSKSNSIAKVFEDAYKSPLSLIIIDNIERLLEYVPIGPRFSNQVLQTLLVVMKRIPPGEKKESKLLVLATTSSSRILNDMEMRQVFKVVQRVPPLTRPEHVKRVFESLGVVIDPDQLDRISKDCTIPIPIKQLIETIEMAKQAGSMVYDRFMECLSAKGLLDRKSQPLQAALVDI